MDPVASAIRFVRQRTAAGRSLPDASRVSLHFHPYSPFDGSCTLSAMVDVALVLKSGGWVSGTLYEFDNDPDPHPHRAIVLTQPRYRPEGSDEAVPIEGADYVVVEAGEIEQLHAAFVQVEIPADSDDPSGPNPSA